jgi:hypothetical protein
MCGLNSWNKFANSHVALTAPCLSESHVACDVWHVTCRIRSLYRGRGLTWHVRTPSERPVHASSGPFVRSVTPPGFHLISKQYVG